MKIDATSSIYSVDRYRAPASKVAQQMQSIAENDKVDLSSDAVSFAEVFASAKTMVRDQLNAVNPMVEVTKNQIANHTYKVDPEEIASSILLFT